MVFFFFYLFSFTKPFVFIRVVTNIIVSDVNHVEYVHGRVQFNNLTRARFFYRLRNNSDNNKRPLSGDRNGGRATRAALAETAITLNTKKTDPGFIMISYYSSYTHR